MELHTYTPVPRNISTGAVATRICNLRTKNNKKQPKETNWKKKKLHIFLSSSSHITIIRLTFLQRKRIGEQETSTKTQRNWLRFQTQQENCREHNRRFSQNNRCEDLKELIQDCAKSQNNTLRQVTPNQWHFTLRRQPPKDKCNHDMQACREHCRHTRPSSARSTNRTSSRQCRKYRMARRPPAQTPPQEGRQVFTHSVWQKSKNIHNNQQ